MARDTAQGAGQDGGDLVCVALVAGAHGVRGAVRLRCFTEAPENVAAYGPVCDAGGRELFALRLLGPAKGGVTATVPGIADRDAAEALKGMRLYVPRRRLPAPDEDEFYHADLIGLAAVRVGGDPLGTVVAVHNYGASDVIEIEAEGGASLLVPFTRAAVPEVDMTARRLVVDPPALR